MWNRLRELSRASNKPGTHSSRQAQGAGETTVVAETTRESVTAEKLDKSFCAEVLGVRSFISDVNPLETKVMARVERLLGGNEDLAAMIPRVPEVIPKLLRLLRDKNWSGKQLASEISQDPALLADVVRVANSPYYRTRGNIVNIEQAMLMLGGNTLRTVIAKAAMKPMLDTRSDYFSKLAGPTLWNQAEKCAASCECLAKQEGAPQFEAYIAGLIHQIGYIIVTRVLSQAYDGADAPRSYAFRDWLIEHVPRLSQRISREWGLPVAVTDTLGEIANLRGKEEISTLAGVVFTASKLSELYVLAAVGRIRGDVKRFSCRINGRLTDSCSKCYAELARLDEAS